MTTSQCGWFNADFWGTAINFQQYIAYESGNGKLSYFNYFGILLELVLLVYKGSAPILLNGN